MTPQNKSKNKNNVNCPTFAKDRQIWATRPFNLNPVQLNAVQLKTAISRSTRPMPSRNISSGTIRLTTR